MNVPRRVDPQPLVQTQINYNYQYLQDKINLNNQYMYSNKQVTDLKNIIDQHFANPEVFEKLKQKIQRDNLKLEDLSNEKLVSILKELKLMDEILVDVNQVTAEQEGTDISDTNEQYIQLKIVGGSAFTDFAWANRKKFIININFQGNQYQTEPVQAECEPAFNQSFKLYFNFDPFAQKPSFNHLLQLDSQVELVLSISNEDNTLEAYSTKLVEWRHLLSFGSVTANLELSAAQQRLKLLTNQPGSTIPSVGILKIKMDLLPKSTVQLIPEKVLNDALTKEKKFRDLDMLRFYEYSSTWWNEYRSINGQFEHRNVKIYAESEDGQFLPVFCFLTPLNLIKGVDTPYHAARFVSLIPLQKNIRPGGDKIDIWSRFHTMLAQQKGEVEDHCNLLCSLFLGFGMEAYVVIGNNMNDHHAWVMTKIDDQVTFWESLTGQRYHQKDPKVNTLFKKVACVYNHNSFYGNIQTNDLAVNVDFSFDDMTKWKRMAQDMVQIGNKKFQQQLNYMENRIDQFKEQSKLELTLKQMIKEYRQEFKLQTKFDQQLEYILTPALHNYEQDRISQQTCGAPEFQAAIKNYLQENTSFKAFPIQLTARDPNKIFQSLKTAPVCRQILETVGNEVFFALKTKLVLYQANVYALWVTVAIRYYASA